MIDLTLRNTNRLFNSSFENGDNDPITNSFHKYYIPLFESQDVKALIDNNLFIHQPIKSTINV